MSQLDPRAIFALIAAQLPKDLHDHLLIIGSLAAAYHYKDKLFFDTVNTKDADVAWEKAVRAKYPAHEIAALGAGAGAGIRALLEHREALEDARFCVNDGLLQGYDVTLDQMQAFGEQLIVDALDPFAERTR